VNLVDEGALAWALADAATALLRPADRTKLCMKIGAGQQASAIRDLLTFYANTQAVLPRELAAPILTWIRGYAGTDSEPNLRLTYDRIMRSAAQSAERQRPEPKRDRAPHRLIAVRSERVKRSAASKRSTLAVCGMKTSIEDLVDYAVEARRVANSAVELAVREARSVNWSWGEISAAFGGCPDEESLRRTFGSSERDFEQPDHQVRAQA
jgi:hypothetical protein